MTTTLYLVTVATWYTFSSFEGTDQINKCALLKEYLEHTYTVEATCVTKKNNELLKDKVVIYPRKPHSFQS